MKKHVPFLLITTFFLASQAITAQDFQPLQQLPPEDEQGSSTENNYLDSFDLMYDQLIESDINQETLIEKPSKLMVLLRRITTPIVTRIIMLYEKIRLFWYAHIQKKLNTHEQY